MENIKVNNQIEKDADALREMADYSKVGREVERLMSFGLKKRSRK